MVTVLVTSGSTVTFKALIAQIVKPDFIEGLVKSGISKLVIQYGDEITANRHLSYAYFIEAIHKTRLRKSMDFIESQKDKSFTLKSSSIDIEAFPFSYQLERYISAADIVISHSGTGSIIDVLSLKKPLILVINSTLKDNHQEEVANEFASAGYCVKVGGTELTTDKLLSNIYDILKGSVSLRDFEKPKHNILQEIVLQELSS